MKISAYHSAFSLRAFVFLVLISVLAVPAFSQQTWERTYGGAAEDWAFAVRQTQDMGYAAVGFTASFGAGAYDAYLVKTNGYGDTVWTQTYGGRNGDAFLDVRQTPDRGYIIVGSTSSMGAGNDDVYIVRTNSFGQTRWEKTYGGRDIDVGRAVDQTSDRGYIIVGKTGSFGAGNDDIYLIKTNSRGDTLWTRTYGGSEFEYAACVRQTSDGGYIVVGRTTSFGNGSQVYLLKINPSGDTIWTKTLGGPRDEFGNGVLETADGGYLIVGGANVSVYDDQVLIIKTNAQGDILWARTYGGARSEYGGSIEPTADGGYVIAGSTLSFGAGLQDVYFLKIDDHGDTLWTRTYGGKGNDRGCSAQQTQDGGYIIAGWTTSFGDSSQLYLIKTDANGLVKVEEGKNNTRSRMLDARLKIHPNPFVSFATVPGRENKDFTVYDVTGTRVGTYRGDRIGIELAAGVYFIKSLDRDTKPVRIVKIK